MASNYGDRAYDRWSWLHIPQALHDGVGQASIQWEGDENPKPLVDRTCVLNEGEWAPVEPPDRITILWGMGVLMGLWIWMTRTRSTSWQLPTVIWFTGSGLISTFFISCWLLSPLEGYGFNENWFVSNPLHLIVLYHLLRKRHMGDSTTQFLDATNDWNPLENLAYLHHNQICPSSGYLVSPVWHWHLPNTYLEAITHLPSLTLLENRACIGHL